MSVKVGGNPTRKEAEDIAGIWETGLWNNHVHADRFMLGDDTAAYLFKVRINLGPIFLLIQITLMILLEGFLVIPTYLST